MSITLCERFAALSDFCQSHPDSMALISEHQTLTYGQMAGRCQGMYNALQDAPQGMVLIHGHKEVDIVPAMMAATYAGRGFVFADVDYPLSRIEQIIETCGCAVVLCTDPSAGATALPTLNTKDVASAQMNNLRLAPSDEELHFYVTFTSGSTGVPKGIPTTRASYAALADWFEPQNTDAAGGANAHINHASMAFDMSMSDIWSALFAGRPLYLLNHANTLNPRANIRHITRIKGTSPGGLAATPAFYALMLEDPKFTSEFLPTLQGFWIGGENVPRQLLRDLRKRFPLCEIYHAYGPSEAACITHSVLLSDEDLNSDAPLPLGTRQSGCNVMVETPDGLRHTGEGQIVLIGAQVAREYWPVDHPNNANFGMVGADRSYQTGDHGTLDENGVMTINGRIDSQVKVNGFRIELGEIERVAMQVKDVKVAVALKAPEDSERSGLILVLSGDGLDDRHIETVRSHLKDTLPAFMVPAHIVAKTYLPLSLAGKIDRKMIAKQVARI